MFTNELITYNNKLYWVYRRIKETTVKEENLNFVKDFWCCDLVLKTKNQDKIEYVFVKEIEDAVLVD